MQVGERTTLDWSKIIESDSRAVNLLGMWNRHLKIQEDFTPGITSVTRRIRYYTLLAWYFENLGPDRVIDLTDFERIFILACLAHHKGDDTDPGLGNVFNKERFKGKWASINQFDLKFIINGFARTYYNRQLDILRCAWLSLGRVQTSPINSKLSSCLDAPDASKFEKTKFRKKDLLDFEGMCICSTAHNEAEKEVMSKLLFGFFGKKGENWDIEDNEYSSFKRGKILLDFEDKLTQDSLSLENILNFENVELVRQWGLRRRNTLFMFLRILDETNPPVAEYDRYLWDAIYFSENRRTHNRIDFGRLEKARKYWEFFQLNVYYVFAMEMLLDVIQRIVPNCPGVEKSRVLSRIAWNDVYIGLSQTLSGKVEPSSTMVDLMRLVEKRNGRVQKTSGRSRVNESRVYDLLYNADKAEDKLVAIAVMLCLLHKRYLATEQVLREYGATSKAELTEDPASIHNIIPALSSQADKSVRDFMMELTVTVVNRHLFEAANRFAGNGTKDWIFTEDGGHLYFARTEPVYFTTRDNRWGAIRSLLRDTGFIEERRSKLRLTNKGREWLRNIE